MAVPSPQSLQTHVRYVFVYHVLLLGLFAVNLIYAGLRMRSVPDADHKIAFVVAVALIIQWYYARQFALRVQDRVIRLELRLRIERLAPDVIARFGQLTASQLTALRFAGDEELPGLARQVVEGKLVSSMDIKRQIRDWQPDHFRA